MASRTVTVIIAGESKKAVAAFNKAEGAAGKFKTALKLGAAAAVGLGVALGAKALSNAIELEKQLSEVATLLPNLTEEGFDKLRDSVLALSDEMGIATNDVVPALYQAISAGVPEENVIDFMRIASEAAIGGVTELETAVDGITSVVNAYGEEAIGAQEASDLMFTAVKLGKTDFESLSAALFNIVPTAASMGVKFEEIAAAMAVMTAQGVPTKIATTQLRALFVEAAKEGSVLADEIENVAGESFTALIEAGVPVHEILSKVRDSMPDDAFRNLFSSVEAAGAALLITGPNAEAMDEALAAMNESAGATSAAFETIADTSAHKMQEAQNRLNNLFTKAGSKLLPVFADALDHVLKAIEFLTPHIEALVKELGDELGPTIQTISDDILPVLSAVVEALWPVVKLIFGLIMAQVTLLFSTIKNTVDLIAALFRGDWAAAWEALQNQATAVLDFIMDYLSVWGEAILSVFEIFGVDLGAIWDGIWSGATRSVTGFLRFFKNDVPRFFKGSVNAIISIFEAIPNAFIHGINAVIRAWNAMEFRVPQIGVGPFKTPSFTIGTPDVRLLSGVTLPALPRAASCARRRAGVQCA